VSAGGVASCRSACLVAGVACLALLAGCGGGEQHPAAGKRGGVLGAGQRSGAWASDVELGWLRRLGAWDSRLLAGLSEGARIEASQSDRLLRHDPDTVSAHEAALAVADTCGSDLERKVGPAPTPRLARALASFRAACSHLERFHTSILLGVLRGDGALVRQARAEAERGGELLQRADGDLPPGEVRPLPVVGGESTTSRIEPRFGGVASWLAGKRVEVRCWSRPDWIRLLREEKAFTRHGIDDDTLGFAGIDGNRVNFAPDICDGLAALTYGSARPASATTRFRLAAAVVTLAHEPQHSGGVAVEAEAECYAIQRAAETAGRLGVASDYARELAELYWAHYDLELPLYRSGECRDGGTYDLRRDTSTWP
jgi:hypothetical protein